MHYNFYFLFLNFFLLINEKIKDVTGYIKYWHYPSKSCIYTITDKELQPLTIDFNKRFETMIIGGYNEKIRVYDVATKKLISTLENK